MLQWKYTGMIIKLENLKVNNLFSMQDCFLHEITLQINFYFKYTCSNKWITIVIYVINQSKLN